MKIETRIRKIRRLIQEHGPLSAARINQLLSDNPTNDDRDATSIAIARMGKELIYSQAAGTHRLKTATA